MWLDLIFALSIRFFLFDFILFKRWREFLRERHYFFRKLFCCTYCQGFWCGLAVSLAGRECIAWHHIEFAFVSAFLSLTCTVLMEPFIREFESDRDLPMT